MNGHDSIILAAGSNVVTSALDLFSQFAIIGGGLWAVYAARDLHKDGAVITAKGDKLTDDPTGERSARPFPYHRPSLFGFVGNVQTGAFSTAIPWSCHPKHRKENIMYGITIAADSGSVVTSALQLFSQFAIIGGGLWAVWGVITLAGGLKDQNGPATQSGVWQVVGGGLIIAAAALFSNIAL